jgi:uncharacterized membrane protein YphA (DoxX/SURF4 family)
MHPATVAARVGLAAVFAVAGRAKLSDLRRTRADVARVGVPRRAVPAVATALPVVELAAAAVLLAGPLVAAAVLAVALMLVFDGVLAARALRGDRAGCGCFGRPGRPLGWTTLGRNGALSAASLFLWMAAQGTLPRT